MNQLGKYEIIEQMGAGSMGKVYRAHDTTLERFVALKTILTGAGVDQEVRQRFIREARACARLQHPNIITVFDLGEVDNTAYIAMEILEGADFRKIVQQRRSIPLEAKIRAAVETCDAIAHAHRHGVIHRDIKPSNLFLTKDGRVKVLDFGIARLPSSKLTVAGQILGTPNYMAPEQILAIQSDGRADLFSFAIVLFEILTYAHPFQGKFIPTRIVKDEPDSLFDTDSSLPVLLDEIIARGLAKDPNKRYQTGDEFAEDLRTVLGTLQGNASAGLSGIQLPSRRAVTPGPISEMPAGTVDVPEGQDPQEWRLSEALRLLPEFEAAVVRRDLERARAAVAELDGRLAGDIRFAEAIRLCRAQLLELGLGYGGFQPAAADQEVRIGTGIPHEHPGQANAYTAVKVDLDDTHFRPIPVSPQPEVSRNQEAGEETSIYPTPSPAPKVPPPNRGPDATPNPGRRKIFGMAAAIVACAILLLAAGVIALRPVPLEPNAATAVVRVRSANIYQGTSASEKKIAEVPMGTQLNVLRLPASRGQEWVNVQVVKPKVLRPGYARVAELQDWHSLTSAAALAIIRLFSPGESGSEGEISTQIQELNSLASRFKGERAAKEALLDAVGLRICLARRRKTSGRPAEEWQADLIAAKQELEPLAGDRDFRAQALELARQIDELLAEKPPGKLPPTPAPIPPPPPQQYVSALLEKVRRLRSDGDYQEALRTIDQILRISPFNKDARALQDKIKRAIDNESK